MNTWVHPRVTNPINLTLGRHVYRDLFHCCKKSGPSEVRSQQTENQDCLNLNFSASFRLYQCRSALCSWWKTFPFGFSERKWNSWLPDHETWVNFPKYCTLGKNGPCRPRCCNFLASITVVKRPARVFRNSFGSQYSSIAIMKKPAFVFRNSFGSQQSQCS